MGNGGMKIKRIKLYKCGYCVNNLHLILKKSEKKKLNFPALVVFIEQSTFGNILYDTGYSDAIYKNGIVSKIYNAVNKTYVKEEDFIINKLNKDSVNKIDKIILSHAHPDHIGGLRFFNDYELISTEKVFKNLEHPGLRNLVFKNMTPLNYKKNVAVSYTKDNFLKKYFTDIYDLFGDESIFGIELSGHSEAQLGLYIPEFKILFAADSCWGEYFLDKSQNMRFIPRQIQNNYDEYLNNIENIKRLKKDFPEINIIFSHGSFEEKQYD